jgi:hypothetical protein
VRGPCQVRCMCGAQQNVASSVRGAFWVYGHQEVCPLVTREVSTISPEVPGRNPIYKVADRKPARPTHFVERSTATQAFLFAEVSR